MEFVLTGFRQDNNVRRYTFQGINDDRKRSEFTVGVDLSLIRKHRIPMQELPCYAAACYRDSPLKSGGRTHVTENDMLGYASRRAANS